jgi:putative transposase
MARPLRLALAGALYHVTSRGDRREAIYFDDDDRERWLELFAQVCKRYNWVCHAWCQMSNHYHIVIETVEGNLSQGMRQLNGVYTQSNNRKYQRVGHVFQGRYKAIIVEKESYLLELARYVVLNPLRARMVQSLTDWPWSSYASMIGREAAASWLQTDWILSQFSPQRDRAIAAYADFVRAGVGLPALWQNLRAQVYLGSDAFMEKMQTHVVQEISEVPRVQQRPIAWSLDRYAAHYSTKQESMVAAYMSGDFTLKKIADHFGVHYSTVSRIVKQYGN